MGEEGNVPEKEDSTWKGLGAGMSLPRTETLEHRPVSQPHAFQLLRWQTELKKNLSLVSQDHTPWAFPSVAPQCLKMSWGPSRAPFTAACGPCVCWLLPGESRQRVCTPRARRAGFGLSGPPPYRLCWCRRMRRCVPGNGRS